MALADTFLPRDTDLGIHPEKVGPMRPADFEKLQQHADYPLELIAGWVVPMSPGTLQTGELLAELVSLLTPLVKSRGWRITLDARHRPAQPPQTVVFPDLAVHCSREIELVPGTDTVARVPELVIELLSEETVERDMAPRGGKLLAYELSGIREPYYAWPDGREAAGFHLQDGALMPQEPDARGLFTSPLLQARLRVAPAVLES